ncbi:hypothetical protein B0I35DRAFT_416024 [Stachybotrys elegans]|uniref:Secreted protein n=1 Tax=Stachybotrys elegans TaxID=80388 RepID=A0A8K0SXH5_9HYPO|nr:hypothetical protein B0I35DRAFT_416024 [Stachybotrys elegans]
MDGLCRCLLLLLMPIDSSPTIKRFHRQPHSVVAYERLRPPSSSDTRRMHDKSWFIPNRICFGRVHWHICKRPMQAIQRVQI